MLSVYCLHFVNAIRLHAVLRRDALPSVHAACVTAPYVHVQRGERVRSSSVTAESPVASSPAAVVALGSAN